MKKSLWLLTALPALMSAGAAFAQPYPIMDRAADKLVQKYQTATCEQLWAERAEGQAKPKSPAEQRAIQMLHEDANMRAAFFARVSAPIVNKMFECGMIP